MPNKSSSDATLVAAGGFEPRTDNISKFISDLERLLNYKNVLD
jgi:hypothetical protein